VARAYPIGGARKPREEPPGGDSNGDSGGTAACAGQGFAWRDPDETAVFAVILVRRHFEEQNMTHDIQGQRDPARDSRDMPGSCVLKAEAG
jgi:hypothetical protein